MVPIEMRKYVPVSIAEVALDWRVIPRDEAEKDEPEKEEEKKKEEDKKFNKVDVLVVAIHQGTIDRYQEIIRNAKLDTSFLEIEVFSTIRSVLDGATSPAMIVDVGAGTTKIYITEHRVLRESHIINRGSQDITLALSRSLGVSHEKANELKHAQGLLEEGAEKGVRDSISLVLDGILAESARALRAYQKRYRRNVGQVIVSGGGAGLKGLKEAAQNMLETETTVADPFSKLVSPAFLEEVLKEAGPEFAVAVGVALRKLEESE